MEKGDVMGMGKNGRWRLVINVSVYQTKIRLMSYDQKILSKRLKKRTRSDIPIRHTTCSLSCPRKVK